MFTPPREVVDALSGRLTCPVCPRVPFDGKGMLRKKHISSSRPDFSNARRRHSVPAAKAECASSPYGIASEPLHTPLRT